MVQTEFQFTLPTGFIDNQGKVHRQGVMRLSRAMDEITPMEDPRVKANPAYATVVILARVITQLGTLEEVTTEVMENLFAGDLNYLQQFYRHINGLEEEAADTDISQKSQPIPAAYGVNSAEQDSSLQDVLS